MKTYVDRKPPIWSEKPAQPVIIVAGEEEATLRSPSYAFSNFWRKVRRKAEDILIRHPHFERVDICSELGEVIRTVNR